jgi:mono/diheme cytochrome c family protein
VATQQQSSFTESRPTADAADYRRVCGICHLDEGQGVPAAFPPLDERLAAWVRTLAGRTYLVAVISNGLLGPIEVAGQRYNGAMPAMGGQLPAPEIAGLLNYVLAEFASTPSDLLFTATEIAETMDTIGTATGASLRP